MIYENNCSCYLNVNSIITYIYIVLLYYFFNVAKIVTVYIFLNVTTVTHPDNLC